MRAIRKGPQPRALLNWKSDNANLPQNLSYGAANFPSEAVRLALLDEQSHLCAYTMKRLKTANECAAQDTRHACHIEHILPQSRGIPGEDIDYHNIVACHPPSQTTAVCEYGAHVKADYDPGTQPFVSPLLDGIERHFRFLATGEVEGVTDEGRATIRVLKLNHAMLVDDRAAAIKGFLRIKTTRPASAAEARRIAQKVMEPDAQACLPAFCVAIAQAALTYAEREEGRAARMKKRQER